MTIEKDLEQMAMTKMIEEAKATSKELANGHGVVSSCPAHASIAKGMRLCLDLTVCILTSTKNGTRTTGLWAGGAASVMVLLVEVLKEVYGK